MNSFFKKLNRLFLTDDYRLQTIPAIRKNINFLVATRGKKLENIDIPKIPPRLEKFPNSNDKWIELKFPVSIDNKSVSSCIYFAEKGSEFIPHVHANSSELIYILNPEGKIEIHTETEKKTITFPNGAFIEKGQGHIARFLEYTMILIIWQPAFEGWEADAYK